MMTKEERIELEELRRYKRIHGGSALNRAFTRLEQLLESVHYDPVIQIRAFRTIAECLICLREELKK